MKSKPVVRADAGLGVGDDRVHRRSRERKTPHDQDQLIDKILSITFPLTPRIERRPDGSDEEHYKLSLREVRQELLERDIDLPVQAISALLDKAFNRRRVIPLVNLSDEERDVDRLEGAVRRYFRVPGFVFLVPGSPEMLDPGITPEKRRAIHGQVIHKMTLRAAPYVDWLLAGAANTPRSDGSPYTIAMAWGWTMQTLGDTWARTRHPGPRPSPLRFQAGIGTTGPHHMKPSEANVNVNRIAPVFGAIAAEMPNEAIVTREQYATVRARLAVANALRAIERADIFISAIGRILPVGEGSVSRISRSPSVNEEVTAAAYKHGAKADICTVLIDGDGQPVRTNFIGVGPTYKGLQAMVQDPKRHLIIVTGGERQRMVAVRAALRGRLVSDLVTDTVTARWLLGEIADPVA